MNKLLWVLIPILCVLFLCGCEESNMVKEFHVLRTTDIGVVIDANDKMAKPKMKFDIFRTGTEIPVARIEIMQTSPAYSVGTIISKIDGSKAQISDISEGMLCRETAKQALRAEKKIYKKALDGQGKLMSLGKTAKYEAKINSWIGADINKLIESWGYPESSFEAPNGNKVYVYSQDSSYTTPMVTNVNPSTHTAYTYGGRTVQRLCNTYFEVDSTGKIIKCTWKGNYCR
jgi:hypothetical protein